MTEYLSHFIFIDLRQHGEEAHGAEDDPTDRINEGGWFDEHQRGRCDETDHCETQHSQRLLEIRIPFESLGEPEIGFADTEHDDQAREHDGEATQYASPYTAYGIAYIGGAVDTDRTRCYLTHCDYIYKLLRSHPSMTLHFHLYQ